MRYEWIKVCGMREAENIRQVDELGVTLMGFIFWSGSSRYVSECPTYLPQKARRVGVFVDADIAYVSDISSRFGLDFVQLHGRESAAYLTALRQVLPASVKLIKACSIASVADLPSDNAAAAIPDLYLFDTKALLPGGTGKQFDWSVLSAYEGNTPFLLSGGIGSDDVARLQHFHHPQCIGIDLNSRFELSPALKDVNLLRKFIKDINV